MNFTLHKYLLKSKHAFWNGVSVSVLIQCKACYGIKCAGERESLYVPEY